MDILRYKNNISLKNFLLLFFSLFALSMLFAYLVVGKWLPNKSHAKQLAEAALHQKVSGSSVKLEAFSFDRIETKRFKTREEDPVGFFSYITSFSPIKSADGKEYDTRMDYYRGTYGEDFDPESDPKRSYTLTGTYRATHTVHGQIEGNFRIVYVEDIHNNWCKIECTIGGNEEILRQDVIGHVMAHLTLSYDIQTAPKVEITYIEQETKNVRTVYTVYGTVQVKDKYGETYKGKFTAVYHYYSYDQIFEKQSIQVSDLFTSPW